VPTRVRPTLKQLETALTALRQTAGLDGKVVHMVPAQAQDPRHAADALVEFAIAGQKYRFAVEAKAALDRAEALWLIKARLDQLKHPGLVFAPYVTDTIARKCRALDVPFIDGVGNAYLKRPGLYLFITGQKPKGGRLVAKPVRGLDTVAALRMVFGLLCHPKLLNAPYRDIKHATGIALGAVGPIFEDLKKRGYLTGGTRKRNRRLVEPVRLFEEWITGYPVKLRPKLNVGRFRGPDTNWWKKARVNELEAVWGGEAGADHLTHHLKPTILTLYVPTERAPRTVTKLVARHRLRADANGDVEILDMFWNFPADPATPDVAPPILVYADLAATLDPRNLEAAKLVREQYIDRALVTF
jgi:hypothetical protein